MNKSRSARSIVISLSIETGSASLTQMTHRLRWPTDPDINPGQTQMWANLIKVGACTEINILDTIS